MLLVKILRSETIEARRFWMRAFINLPRCMLPVRARSTHILQHLMAARPFNVEFSTKDLRQNNNNNNNDNNNNPPTPDALKQQQLKRMTEIVNNLAKDFQLRKATTNMMQDADVEVMNDGEIQDPEEEHQQKVDNM